VLGKEHLAWWGHNAPYHVYHVPYLNFLFPNCKFIVVLRDPRDVFATGKVDSGWDLLKFREEWEQSLLHGLLSKLGLGAARVQEVQYETLVTNPQGVGLRIGFFVTLESKFARSNPSGRQASSSKAVSSLIKPMRAGLRPIA
jgi:hypothetical protein